MSKFTELTDDRDKMESFLKNDLGLDVFAMGYVKDGKMSVVDSMTENALSTFGLYDVMVERNGLQKKAMVQKPGVKADV